MSDLTPSTVVIMRDNPPHSVGSSPVFHVARLTEGAKAIAAVCVCGSKIRAAEAASAAFPSCLVHSGPFLP